MMKILKTTKLYDNRIYLPIEVRDILKISNGEIIIFGINENGEIVIFKNKKDKKIDRFNVSVSKPN
ncbi:hypothetical protein LCGC14_1248130 [marine sediment metagenome]|uniref:SpoVT-AbrB domain-containing protein n=1 Tax=marine sediment metagenome TaxID=412755 RepID=A0A0F9L3V6_9ZZZZ